MIAGPKIEVSLGALPNSSDQVIRKFSRLEALPPFNYSDLVADWYCGGRRIAAFSSLEKRFSVAASYRLAFAALDFLSSVLPLS